MKLTIKWISVLFIIFNFQFAIAADSAAKKSTSVKKEVLDIRVTNAIIHVPLATSKTTTGYFTLTNHSGSDVSITGVSANFSKIKLTPTATWVVKAHESLSLSPKGHYLQFNDLKSKITTGDELHLTISLSNGQKLQVIAVAKSAYDQLHGH